MIDHLVNPTKSEMKDIQELDTDGFHRQYGFLAHLVTDATDCPLGFNAHTHGLPVSWGHMDLQIVFPMKAEVVMALFWAAVRHIQEGTSYEDGDVAWEIAGGGYKVKFVKVQESGRDVLRMIIPDKAGNLDVENITGNFRHQYCDLYPCEDNHATA